MFESSLSAFLRVENDLWRSNWLHLSITYLTLGATCSLLLISSDNLFATDRLVFRDRLRNLIEIRLEII